MKPAKTSFIKGRIKSIKYAFKGFFLLLSTEHSIITQVIIGCIACIAGYVFDLSKAEWIAQLFAIGLVLTTESLNTAIEKICDFIQPNFDPKIGEIKDIAAGAVTFAALTACIIAAIIYIPKIL